MSTRATGTRHLLALDGMAAADLVALLDAAEEFLPVVRREAPPPDRLQGRFIANLFLEPSTRTRSSFTLAASRLGAQMVDLGSLDSSVTKGETYADTARTIEAMGVDAIIVRTSASGAPAIMANAVNCPIINAGDGRHEHPTQGLLDLMTLRQCLGDLAGLTVGIVGDIAHSRVARSDIHGLTTLGANVMLIGPPTMAPKSFEKITTGPGIVTIRHDLDECLSQLDGIIMLRVQFERGGDVGGDYRHMYCLNPRRAAKLRPGAPVMHPGPMNRGLEIDSAVADDPDRSVILRQVTNGVAVRMAVLVSAIAPGA